MRKDNLSGNFMYNLIRNNTGVSSKSFFLVVVTLVGILMLLVLCFILVWDICSTGTASVDLMGVAAVIGAISTMFVTVGITKVLGERNECNCKSNNDADKTE